MASVVVLHLWQLWKSLQHQLRLSTTTWLLCLHHVRLQLVADNLLRIWMDVDLHLGYKNIHNMYTSVYLGQLMH